MYAPRKALAAGAAILALGLAGCSSDLSVPAPEAQARQQTVAQLAKAAQAQGICYGWELDSGAGITPISRGSNLGDTVAVDSDERSCPRWVEVQARVSYVSESSESEDYASVMVITSPDLDVGTLIAANLDRFGLDEQAFIDDPGLAICRAALALPLLTAESGAADPAPTPSAQPAAAPAALESAGSDFWRDRRGYVLAGAGLFALAALFLLIGVRQRRKTRDQQPANPVEHLR